MSNKPELSVVVCFKDWGLERLEGVTKSIQASGLGDRVEVVIADYGSEHPEGYRESLETLGAKYFYFETDGIWSRSRALNLGIREARGTYVVTTDSDMVFTPGTFPRILELLRSTENSYFIVQCRDLPEGIKHQDIENGVFSWDQLESVSRLRPRWGMGGLIAFSMDAYVELRGLDERLHTYGGEDIDLAKRLGRIGLRRVWVDEPQVKMFHVWHPSSLESAEKTAAGKAAVVENRRIHLNDASTCRNLEKWEGRPSEAAPLVTVAISTFNRAEYLEESLKSVLAQSFRDFEVVVVNDGSTDSTAEILESIDDPRLRVYHQENKGLAATRNFITQVARGKYIAVHDDDDIMLPYRLERQLEMVGSGVNGSYGGWVDFDNETGDLEFHRGKNFSVESLAFSGGVYLHPTLLIETRLLSLVPYDSSMRSGSDYNLAVRLARMGVNLKHCGDYVLLRRGHEQQITNTAGRFQKVSGRLSGGFARSTFGVNEVIEAKKDRGRKDWVKTPAPEVIENGLRAYLPDHLSARSVGFTVAEEEYSDLVDRLRGIDVKKQGSKTDQDGKRYFYKASDIALRDLFDLKAMLGSNVSVHLLEDEPVDSASRVAPIFPEMLCSELQSLAAGRYEIQEIPPKEIEYAQELAQQGATLINAGEDCERTFLVRELAPGSSQVSASEEGTVWWLDRSDRK